MASSNPRSRRDIKLAGLPASPGIAVGRALRLDERGGQQVFQIEISPSQVRAEIRRIEDAFRRARAQLQETKSRLAPLIGYEHSYILDAHLLMLEDENLLASLKHEIRNRHVNAEWAVREVIRRIVRAYKKIKDPYLRERASDIEDVAARLLKTLSGDERFDLSRLDEDVIVVAEEIWPSTIAELDFERVRGFATDAGGPTSHSAIIARALGIPSVVGLRDIARRVKTGDVLILDGSAGEVILRPTRAVIRAYLEKARRDAELTARPLATAAEPAVTLDGMQITLRANAELPAELASLNRFGAQGVGLYRSEFIFLTRLPKLPTEDEQMLIYRKLAEAAGEDGASIRVFDLGGDKLTLEGFEEEQNPALGLRAIRLSLHMRDLFRTQVRAILRANLYGRLRLVLPLVSTLPELREAKQIIEQVKNEMAEAGVEHNAHLPVGVMIEVPAAALMADMFAREADFLCIGTNDLIQYLLAVDRANEAVAHLYQPLHPAVLRAIVHVARMADEASIPVEVCGEMAADPLQAVVLVGLGIRTLSLAPAAIPIVKNAIRSIDASRLRAIVSKAIKLASAAEVEELLARELPAHAPLLGASVGF